MIRRIALVVDIIIGGAVPALADIPVNDAAQLTQKSQTAGTTIKLAPVTTQRQTANNGVHCAVTTGKKASITDPTVQPQTGAGAQAIQTYAPDQPATPDPAAQGAAANSQTLFQSSGNVVAGLNASSSTMTAASSAFQSATLTNIAQEALRNSINIPPTIYLDQGTRIIVFVRRDLDFSSLYPDPLKEALTELKRERAAEKPDRLH